jgi:hypothetical protein
MVAGCTGNAPIGAEGLVVKENPAQGGAVVGYRIVERRVVPVDNIASFEMSRHIRVAVVVRVLWEVEGQGDWVYGFFRLASNGTHQQNHTE